jgi:hypothetical protein
LTFEGDLLLLLLVVVVVAIAVRSVRTCFRTTVSGYSVALASA